MGGGGVIPVPAEAEAVAPPVPPAARCANCGAVLHGPYCARCGQAADVHRRSVRHLLADLFQDVASFDSRILRTARALLFQPGELSLAFLQGRTQGYVPAVRLYLFVSLIFFIVLAAAHIALVQFGMQVVSVTPQIGRDGHVYVLRDGHPAPLAGATADAEGHVIIDGERSLTLRIGQTTNTIITPPRFLLRIGAQKPAPPAVLAHLRQIAEATRKDPGKGGGGWMGTLALASVQALARDPAALNGALTEWLPRILFLLLPLFACLVALFHLGLRGQMFFVDHLVFSLNFHSFAFVALLLAAGLAQLLAQWILGVLLLLVLGLYLLLAMKRFYRQRWPVTVLKFAGIGLIYTCFILVPAFVGLLAVSVLYG